jgi:hypothetical protein
MAGDTDHGPGHLLLAQSSPSKTSFISASSALVYVVDLVGILVCAKLAS